MEDRRSEDRLVTNLSAEISFLGTGALVSVPCTILNFSGRGLLLQVPSATSCGVLVRLETSDTLLLGEVLRCEPYAGEWRIAVQARHQLSGLREIERLNRALLGYEGERRRPESARTDNPH